MNQAHLTDDQLQEYLDGNIPATDPPAIHLDTCPRCREALAVYRSMYTAMESDPGYNLSPDFADSVMARLPQTEQVSETEISRGFHIKESTLVMIALAVVAAVGIYFINPATLIAPLTGMPGPSESLMQGLLTEIQTHVSTSGRNIMIIVFALMTFIGIGAVDRVISHRRRHHKPISYLV